MDGQRQRQGLAAPGPPPTPTLLCPHLPLALQTLQSAIQAQGYENALVLSSVPSSHPSPNQARPCVASGISEIKCVHGGTAADSSVTSSVACLLAFSRRQCTSFPSQSCFIFLFPPLNTVHHYFLLESSFSLGFCGITLSSFPSNWGTG